MRIKSKDIFKDPKGWVLFDGQCRFCIGWADRFGPWLHKQGFGLAPLQTDWVRERLQVSPDHLLDEMRVITDSNQVLEVLMHFFTCCDPHGGRGPYMPYRSFQE